jgi:hypothetical protein
MSFSHLQRFTKKIIFQFFSRIARFDIWWNNHGIVFWLNIFLIIIWIVFTWFSLVDCLQSLLKWFRFIQCRFIYFPTLNRLLRTTRYKTVFSSKITIVSYICGSATFDLKTLKHCFLTKVKGKPWVTWKNSKCLHDS